MTAAFEPVKCEVCGRTMPRGIADDPERHSCAAEALVERVARALASLDTEAPRAPEVSP